MSNTMPSFSAEASLYVSNVHYRAPSGSAGQYAQSSIVLPAAISTGGGLGNQDPSWCDLKHSLCIAGCWFKGIYWWFRFGSEGSDVLSTACEVGCSADRSLCRIT